MPSANDRLKKMVSELREEAYMVDPVFKGSNNHSEFQSDAGYIARLITSTSYDLMRSFANLSEELIGYVTVLDKSTLHIRGSIIDDTVGFYVDVPDDWAADAKKRYPADNQYVKLHVTYSQSEPKEIRKIVRERGKQDDLQLSTAFASDYFVPVLDDWFPLRRDTVYDLPFKAEEYTNMVWDSLDAQINGSNINQYIELRQVQDILLANGISTPTLNSKTGGIFSHLISPSYARRHVNDFLKRYSELFPTESLKIKFGRRKKKVDYFVFNFGKKDKDVVDYFDRRDSGLFQEDNLNFRYDGYSKLKFPGEINLALPDSISISEKGNNSHYKDHIRYFNYVMHHNAPILRLNDITLAEINSLTEKMLERFRSDPVESKYLGPNNLLDPAKLEEQLHRLVVVEARKTGNAEITVQQLADSAMLLEKTMLMTIHNIERSSLKKALNKSQPKTGTLSPVESNMIGSYMELKSSFPYITKELLFNHIQSTSSTDGRSLEHAFDSLKLKTILIETLNDRKEKVLKVIV